MSLSSSPPPWGEDLPGRPRGLGQRRCHLHIWFSGVASHRAPRLKQLASACCCGSCPVQLPPPLGGCIRT
eukprot:12801974-Alexandrium_andersonii.AAC.1